MGGGSRCRGSCGSEGRSGVSRPTGSGPLKSERTNPVRSLPRRSQRSVGVAQLACGRVEYVLRCLRLLRPHISLSTAIYLFLSKGIVLLECLHACIDTNFPADIFVDSKAEVDDVVDGLKPPLFTFNLASLLQRISILLQFREQR